MIRSFYRRLFSVRWILPLVMLLLASCETNMVIINDVDEREANEIVVFLASRRITAHKISSTSTAPGGAAAIPMFNIAVTSDKATEAMAILNQIGLPRRKSTTLLDLFAGQGLMKTAQEETIRYQAGLAEEIAGMIRKIDGVLDASVQLAFPPTETGIGVPGAPKQHVTASVYVKHQGVLDDPNSHLISKIKRLVAASVNGLDINDVTVIPDRARYTDISLGAGAEALTAAPKEYVSIWSIVMNKESASRFRFLFFTLTFAFLIVAAIGAWVIWKFYPILRQEGGWKELLNPKPYTPPQPEYEYEEEEEEEE